MNERLKEQARKLRAAQADPMRKQPRSEGTPMRQVQPIKDDGEHAWHGVTGNRSTFPLPIVLKGQGPARAHRTRKGQDGY